MSTRDIEDDFGDPDRNPRSGWFARIAHVILPIAAINTALSVWNWFANVPDWLAWANTVVFSVVFMAALLHQALARICLRCMEEVPADAPVRAQRRRSVLWFEHRTKPIWIYLLMWLAAIALSGGLRYALYRGLPTEDVHDNWTSAPVTLLILLVVYAMVLHHRLQPWCPYCKGWDEGGDHERTPTPDPTGVKTG
jgi:hypothetical protein